MWMRVGFGLADRSLRRRLSRDFDRVFDFDCEPDLDLLRSSRERLRDAERDLRASLSSFFSSGFFSLSGFLSFTASLSLLFSFSFPSLLAAAGVFLSATFFGLPLRSPPLLEDDDELELLLLLLELDELEEELRDELLSDELLRFGRKNWGYVYFGNKMAVVCMGRNVELNQILRMRRMIEVMLNIPCATIAAA